MRRELSINMLGYLNKFQGEKKLGGRGLILDFQSKLENGIETKYNNFKLENDNKKEQFEVYFNILRIN